MNPETVHLFVFDSLSDWEPAYAVAGINSSNFQVQPGRYRVATVGLTTQPVKTTGGITILPELTLDSLQPGDSAMLILPGGMAWEEGCNVEAAEKAKTFVAAGVPVAAICAATAALARIGLLDTRRHTSNSFDYIRATKYQGALLYRKEAAVCDGDVITAGGVAPLEFAYQIFQRLGLFRPETLEAWHNLFKTGDMRYYAALLRSVEGDQKEATG
jgi:transcriptional regulator GlxA family with amidase domain